ncbi:MAG: DNA-directed RNA polymerase subunit omega [Chloracidobacterium sp.]|nr:DNA-directed RNA polymerase subunit omega [Chloracidobacterium sp.]
MKTVEAMTDVNEEAEEVNEQQEEEFDPPEIDSKYRMIILAAQRSKQLQRGANPRTNLDIKKTKPTRVAMKELAEGLVNFEILDNQK